MIKPIISLMLGGALITSPAYADQRNDVPSCYDYAKVSELNDKTIEREFFILVDQTVHLDTNMKKRVHAQLANFGKEGDKISLVTFSAMAKGEYTSIPFSGYFEKSPSQATQDDMNALGLRSLKSCLKKQSHALNAAHRALKESFNDADESYPKTELVGTVLSIGNDLVSQSSAKRKIVLLVSDMLENSESLTFYSRGSVKVPDATESFQRISEQGFVGDFAGAEIYVIGAGYIHGGKNYNSQKSMIELEKFWRQVFNSANVELKQFGKPNLLRNIM
ncbi:hypothetical protein [Agarivorans gilvus]|uniref:VWFA domain-containing protein n=1 Tax=Agarivorans gilvus TaxID=680279 RepID=A0ABQ1I0Y4_9ALTE|nr:hypothetical protein [Agarivorans gilvus]GGB05425.1 hypothetical protein GCM10007414_18450 [Agarivorans gilvus]